MPHTLVQRGTVTVPPRRFCPLSSSSSSFSSSSSSLDTPPTFPVARRPLPPPPPPFADTIGERLYPAFTSGAGDFTRLQRCSSKRAVNTASRMHRNRYYSIASSVVASVSRD